MKLAVIVPTIGRESLVETLDSLRPQLGEDAVGFVACDAKGSAATWVEMVSRGFVVFQIGSETPWGSVATNRVLDALPEDFTHVWRIDDDDVATPTALGYLKRAACHLPVFAKFSYVGGGGEIWSSPALAQGNIGTPCILAPRGKSRWGDRYEADFDYALRLVEEFGECLWLDRVVANVTIGR